MSQNGQRNLWKGLEQDSLDLEKLGEKLGGGRGSHSRGAPVYRLIVNSIRTLPLVRGGAAKACIECTLRAAGAVCTAGAAPAGSGTASVAPAFGPSLARQAL